MKSESDQQLLFAYSERRSEAAFAELVRRHVDLVYSAAVRMVKDAHLAEDVTQRVFVALAQNARCLQDHPVLSGWLHRTAQNIAANVVRSDVRRRAREQEVVAMNELLNDSSGCEWDRIAPHLDSALGELNDQDRDALLLRYFERKSAREMACVLAVSEEAAQKRVSRAIERLRELFLKRGVTVGAGGIVAALTTGAVHAAPLGLEAAISAAAVLAGACAPTSTTLIAAKALTMTTTQKIVITATLAVAAGTGIYEGSQASRLRDQVQALSQHQASMEAQYNQLLREGADATNRIAALNRENEVLRQMEPEIGRLRGEVAKLRTAEKEWADLKERAAHDQGAAPVHSDPFSQSVLALVQKAAELHQRLERMPDKKIPELSFLTENQWLEAAREADMGSEVGVRKALSSLRSLAKNRLGPELSAALDAYIQANNGQLPTDIRQLVPHLKMPLDDSILDRYELLRSGKAADLPQDAWVISEKRPVDRDYDSHLYVAPKGRSGSWGTGVGSGGDPDPEWTKR